MFIFCKSYINSLVSMSMRSNFNYGGTVCTNFEKYELLFIVVQTNAAWNVINILTPKSNWNRIFPLVPTNPAVLSSHRFSILFINSWDQILRSIEVTSCGLTRWGRGTHICFGKLIIIGSDNSLSPDVVCEMASIVSRPQCVKGHPIALNFDRRLGRTVAEAPV